MPTKKQQLVNFVDVRTKDMLNTELDNISPEGITKIQNLINQDILARYSNLAIIVDQGTISGLLPMGTYAEGDTFTVIASIQIQNIAYEDIKMQNIFYCEQQRNPLWGRLFGPFVSMVRGLNNDVTFNFSFYCGAPLTIDRTYQALYNWKYIKRINE